MRFLTYLHRRPILVISCYALILLYGTAVLRKITVELLPILPLPGITVVTEIEGFSPEEVEAMVTAPLERSFLELNGLNSLSSMSEEGISTIILEFALGTETSLCFAETAEIADEIYARLPNEASKPVLSNTSRSEEGPLIRASVEPRSVSFEELAANADDILTSRLLHAPEIGRVALSGTLAPRIMVRFDSGLLRAAGISPSMIGEILETNLADYYLGTVENRRRYRSLRLTGGISTPGEISTLPIPSPEGGYSGLTLADVAEITTEYTPAGKWAYRNGKPFLGIEIYRHPAVPTLRAARAVRRRLSSLEEEFPYLLFSVIEDASGHLGAAVRDLLVAVLVSTLSALLVLSIFYSGFKAALVILASLPGSLLPTVLTLHILGKGLNTVSLAGMVMGVGLIVDCSILVFHRYINGGRENGTLRSLLPALTASTITSGLVFIPVLFLPGVTSALFRDLALTVSLLLLYSLAAATILIPTLIGIAPGALRPHAVHRRCMAFSGFYVRGFKRFGRRFVFPGLPLVCAAAFACCIVLPKIPLPADRRASVLVSGMFSPKRSEEQNRKSGRTISRELHSLPGSPEVIVEGERDTLRCLLSFPRKDSPGIHLLSEVDSGLATLFPGEGIGSFTSGPPPSPLSPFFSTTGRREYLLLADTREGLLTRVESICAGLVDSGLCKSAEYEAVSGGYRRAFVLDPALVRLSGSDPEAVSRIASYTGGESLTGVLRAPSGSVQVFCTAAAAETGGETGGKTSEEITAVVPTPSGSVPLASLGILESAPSAERLERFGGSPVVKIRIRSTAPGRRIEAFILRTDGEIEPVPEDENLKRSIRNVFGALALSVLLIFCYLVLHYNTLRLPLLLTAFLPVPAAGSLFVLGLFGRSINIGSVLGILITLGTCLNTMIVITESVSFLPPDSGSSGGSHGGSNGGIKGGAAAPARSLWDIVLDSSGARGYPLAATVATTVCAAVPGILLCGYAFQRDTAFAVAGGVLFGSIFLMMSFPKVLYGRLSRHR